MLFAYFLAASFAIVLSFALIYVSILLMRLTYEAVIEWKEAIKMYKGEGE